MEKWNLPHETWILIDTNILIDYYFKQNIYNELFQRLKKNNNTLVSIELVKCEFIRSKIKETVKKKHDLFQLLIEAMLPLDKEIFALVQPTIEQYGQDIEKVSITDIYLACFIQRYKKTFLLTRNHSDFPLKLFKRNYLFSLEFEKEIKTYAFYQYSQPDNSIITTTVV